MKLKNFCIMLDRADIAYTIEVNDDASKQCLVITGYCNTFADFTFDMEGNLLTVNVGN